jgi:phospholipid transport system substrate-binding protein
MQSESQSIGRRGTLMLTAATAGATLVRWPARAATGGGGNAALFAPVTALNNALIASMRSGSTMSFARRYQMLEPVIDRVFNLNAVLAASVGLSWAKIPDAQKATLSAAFRRYTVSSYVANFNSYNGQRFDILPDTRTLGSGQVVVQTRLIRTTESPVRLDYVMRSGPAGWQIVDVLTEGTISRVAVQRSDFQQLLRSGGVAALTSGLERKVGNLSGSMQG